TAEKITNRGILVSNNDNTDLTQASMDKRLEATTENDLSEEALREAAEKYRDLFENANDAIFIVDADLHYVDVNKRATELYGYSREEFLRMSILDVIPPEQRPRSDDEFNKLRNHGTYEKFTGRMRTKDGRWMDIEVNSSAIIRNGKVVGSRDIVRDVTERKRAEDALRASQNFLQTVIETEPECVKLLNADGALLMMNRSGLNMIEAESLDQVRGTSIYDLIAPAYRDAFKANVKSVFEGKSGILEFDMIGLKGRQLHLETHAVPLRNENNEISALLGVTRDITERKKLEEELIKAQKLESVGLLAGGIAHDFNNLLTAILGNISLAKMQVSTVHKAFARLEEAEKASLRARDLTQQLLTFARGGAPVRKTTSIIDVIREASQFALRGSAVSCTIIVPDDLRPVEVDEGQMSQVIHNLIINADHSMPAGGIITITGENVFISGKDALPLPEGEYVHIAVRDQGMGIEKELLPRIFDPYFTTKRTGSGLGLATTYSIMKRHDGHISVESEVGVGTTFHLYLPASHKKLAAKAAGEQPIIPGEGTILVMDDEEMVRMVVIDMLSSLGYAVVTAADGADAIDLYAKARSAGKRFDAVIMDLTVPGGMGGKEAIKKLIEIDPAVKALVSSGYSNDPIMAEHEKYGFAGVIAKPYTMANLREAIGKALQPIS
ncbi:MAG TPA: PAS domain S-box protein, partial [Nitrospirota bacterium]